MTGELYKMWIQENLWTAERDCRRVEKAYEMLADKETQYANDILALLKVKEKIVSLWEKAEAKTK